MLRTVVFLFAGAAAFLSARAEGDSARILRDIPYYPESAYTNDFMSRYARLDLRLPAGATNFATVVTFHGGGLVHGFRGDFFRVRERDDIACVSAGYRLLTNATPSECVGDAAAAVAWTLKHIAEYGGDPKKVFVTGYSGGGYLTLMVGMNPKWLKPHGYRPQQLAGLFPSTGQTSTHFTIRKMTGDDTPTYLTKVDEWAPLAYAARDLPPILLMTGENELDIPCRAEENRLLYASLKALGHPDVEQHAFWGRQHNNVWADTGFYQEDFVRRLSRAIDGRTYSGGPNRVRAVLEKARSVPGLETDFVSLVSSPAYELSATCVMARGNRADRPGDGDAFAVVFEAHPALLKELGMFKTRQRKGKDGTSHWETTATDLVRLAQMIAHRGEWYGRRLMSEADCAREFPLPYAFRSRLFAEADGSCGVLFPLKAVQDAALEPLAADFLSALSVHGETTTVAELRPDGTNDMTAAVMAAVDRARAANGGRIVFAPGDYHFKSPRQMSFYVSNHDNPMPRNVFLPVTNLVGVTFESSAARFVCHGEGIACALIDTDAVTVKGIAFDYFRPYFTEWRLRGGKLMTDKQAYPYEIDADGKIVATGPGWREKQTLAAFFDRLSRVYLGCEWWDGKADHRFTKYPEGTVVVTRNGYRPNPCVFLYRAKDSVFEECGAYSSGGMGLIAQRSENVRIAGWRTRRDRFTGLQADATHFSNCRGLVSVTDSLFEGMVDDAINVHSTCLKIVEKKDARTIVCQYMHKQSVGFEVFLAGETLRFIRGATLEPGAEVRVADAKPLAFDRVELTLDGAMPESYGVGDAVENADWQPAVVFSRNMVRNSSPRATLFTTPGRIVCESNVFEHVAGQPILFAGDAWDWYESGACRDVTIRGNVFDGCARTGGKGMIQITPAVHDLAAQKERYHRNILVEDNLFRDYKVPLVFGHSADNLVLRGNRIVNGSTNVVLTGSGAVTNDGGRPLKVLMVGNSFSESVLVELPNVARATGNRLVLVNLMIGGCPLRRHWNNYLQSEADPKFRPYTVEVNWEGEKKVANTPLAKVAPYVHATLQDVVRAEKWDLITVQQASPDSWKQETYQPYADNLIAKLRELAPQAEIRVHQTWAYNVQEGIDQRMMYEGIVQSYGELAAAHGFAVIPVGEAIQRYRAELPVTFVKRMDAAAVKAVPTDVLPDTGGEPVGFFYWNTGRPWEKRDPKGDYRLRWDGCHLNPEGKYLQALVWYGCLFGGDPREVPYAPEKLDPHRAEVMRTCAASVTVGN